jgi:uncharacterized protein (TIRG00374 family)
LLSTTAESKTPRNRIIFWISILLAGLFLFLALRGLDWSVFTSSVRSASYGYLPLVFIWGSISSWIRAVRWRVLLAADKDIPARNVFWANMAGYLGNTILPARAGELVRALYIGKENNISTSFCLATGLVERFIDLLALILLGSLSLAYAGIIAGPLQAAIKAMSVIAIVGIIMILIAPYIGSRLLNLFAAIPFLKTSAGEKVMGFSEQFLHGMEALHHPRRIVVFTLYTSIIWLMDGIGTMLVARSLHLELLLYQAFVLLSGLGLSSAIPSTPGYVGVYQFVAISVLGPFGISNATALAFIIFLQMTNIFIILFWGGIAVLRSASYARPIDPAAGKS